MQRKGQSSGAIRRLEDTLIDLVQGREKIGRGGLSLPLLGFGYSREAYACSSPVEEISARMANAIS